VQIRPATSNVRGEGYGLVSWSRDIPEKETASTDKENAVS